MGHTVQTRAPGMLVQLWLVEPRVDHGVGDEFAVAVRRPAEGGYEQFVELGRASCRSIGRRGVGNGEVRADVPGVVESPGGFGHSLEPSGVELVAEGVDFRKRW